MDSPLPQHNATLPYRVKDLQQLPKPDPHLKPNLSLILTLTLTQTLTLLP